MDAEVQAEVPRAGGLAILGDFRGRTARTTARYAIIASVLVVGGAIARYLEGGDAWPLFSVGFWLVADLLWWSSLRRLSRGEVDAAASRILVGVALIVAVASLFDATILALTAYLLGFPVLQICALAIAPPAHMRLWSRSLPPIFAVLVLGRRFINPLPALEDPVALLTVALGGALGLVIISRLSLGLLDALRGSLSASEGVRGELAAANRGLEEARDQALAANQAKSAFLATMSHELRTPLNAIIGYSELIEEDAEEPELRADVGRILEASRHLLELINDVLDLSKIEAGRMDLFYETIRVDALIRGVADTIRPTIERNDSRLVLNLGGGLGTIDSDLTKVRQILLNLASNAAKFTAGGTVEIVAREVRGAAGEAGLELAVRDSGIGIDGAKLATIFEPFTQADASTTRRYGGTGLGLAITRRFVEMLGGTIDVTSVVGEGSCFTVWLPRRAPGAPARREGSSAWRLSQLEEASASMSMSVGPVSGLHVLVIDDDPEVHQRLRRLLVKEGCRVSVAASGAEGLEIARRDRPDLVTLDVVKRGADGWEVLCELKGDAALTGAPVRVISNAARSGALVGLAVADFVSTPLRGGHFAALLERAKVAGERARVLIVDDEASVREELRAAVDVRYWEVAEASGGAEAMAALRDAPPDLLVLDLMMPVVDGFAVLERIASTPALRGLPVLVTAPQVLTIAEIYLLRERVLSLLQERGVDGEALLKEAVADLRERVALENSAS